VFHDPIEQHQRELATLQTFAFLLTLVEALVAIQDQEEGMAGEKAGHASPGIAAGTSLVQICSQVLGYRYVGVFALDPPDNRLHLLGVSGLTPEQEQRFRAATDHTPLTACLDPTAMHQLSANQVVLLDVKQLPLASAGVPFGARYLLVAPMVLHEQLIGLFVIAKTDAEYPDIHSAYTQEEIELAKEIAEMMTRVIERVRVLDAWAKAHAHELAAQEINRCYDTFLTIASHELRTPLTTIKGSLQLALRRLATLEQQGKHLPSSVDMIHRLLHLLERALQSSEKLKHIFCLLLDASRIQAEQFVVVKRPCNLVEIVRSAVENVQRVATDRTILLSLPEEKTVPIIADADRINQVVTNYLTNALKYSPAPHPIEVRLAVEEAFARVSVRDEGPGFSLEEQARIWERFYRLSGIQEPYGSDADLGLDLYLCRAIIARHRGRVGIQSAPGEGATFWFTLPLAQTC
jgi:signal transduction histidine kinase